MRRLALPAAAALALGGLAAPAQAAPGDAEPLVGVYVPEQIAVIAGKTKTIRAEVGNVGNAAAKNVVVSFAGVDPALELTLPAGCDATSCKVGDLAAGARKTLTFTVAVTGDELVSTFRVATNVGFETEVSVVRSAGGVDLEVEPIDDLKLTRGRSAALPLAVHNTGSETVDSVGLLVLGEEGITALGDYRNCLSLDEFEDDTEESELGVPGILCKFDQEFAPGSTLALPKTSPIRIQLDKDAGGPYTYSGAVLALGVNDDDAALLAKKKTGRALSLTPVSKAADITDGTEPDDINAEDNVAYFGVTAAKSAADSAAVGGAFSGRSETVEVGLRNLGPTTLIPGDDQFTWVPSVRVSIPAGVELSEVDINCMPGTDAGEWDFDNAGEVDGLEYTCFPDLGAKVGETVSFAFTGKATKQSAPGSVVVDGGVQDVNHGNDRAQITVAAPAGTGGTGGGLPVTGAPAGWVALGGAALLVAGGVAAFAFRRRRIVTTL
ncbi:hypothetical protein [Actinoplanes sp. URMC 104]|uniref:hypothetical protein n=1 Tax=Actinoplanes sp. URMC 104 TaxID=3423409 RepID=UPI003F1CB073